MLFFFFSSRRRHTRLQGDWSSDVCSSDLIARAGNDPAGEVRLAGGQADFFKGLFDCGHERVRHIRYDEVLPDSQADFAGTVSIDEDRKSTRLNSSHLVISYAVFCLKKKKHQPPHPCTPIPPASP